MKRSNDSGTKPAQKTKRYTLSFLAHRHYWFNPGSRKVWSDVFSCIAACTGAGRNAKQLSNGILNSGCISGRDPGAAAFADDETSWRQYIADAMIETVLARDVFQLAPVTKPILMRHLFGLAARYPAQILSYNKMLGQLLNAGNTTTLAHYLRLLQAAFLVSGLEQFSAGQLRKRGSSPELIFWNNALINSVSGLSRQTTLSDSAWYGRIVENAVGAHLLNHLHGTEWSITHWRDGNKEVDFVVQRGQRIWRLEVKSGRTGKCSGMEAFRRRYPAANAWVIGSEGLALEDFFARNPVVFFE